MKKQNKNQSRKEFIKVSIPMFSWLGTTIFFNYWGTIEKRTDRDTYIIKDEFYEDDKYFKKKYWLFFSDKKVVAFIKEVPKEDQNLREVKREYCRQADRKSIKNLVDVSKRAYLKIKDNGWKHVSLEEWW